MKKLIVWFLVFAMCFSMFAGCKQEQVTPTTEPIGEVEPTEAINLGDPDGLANALEYLRTIYKNAGGLTPQDFTRIGTVPVGTTKYEIVWTASVGEDLVKIVRGADGMVTIDVNELCDVETPYTLTATITDAAGNSVSHSWEHIIPAYLSAEEILKQAYALASGESLPYEATLTGVVTSIDTVWSDQYGNITVTMVVEGLEDMPVQCYRLSGDDAKNIAVGDTITVTGTLTNYKGTIEFAQGCTLDNRISGGGEAPGEKEYAYSWPLNDGDKVVIYNRSYKKALSSKKVSTFYNLGVDVSTDANGKLTGYGPNEVWTVKHNGSSYSFVNTNGDKMALDKEYSNLNAASSYDDWKLVRVGSGKYLIQNTKRSDYFLEWYDKYGNFSTYNAYTPEEDKQFIFSFYVIPEDEVVEDTTVYFDATPVENPEAGKAYKLVLFQNGLGKELGFTGKMAGYYYETSDDLNAVVDVYLEEAEGGYMLYFMDGETKTYLNVVPRGGEGNEGKVNVVLETTGKSVYALNTEFCYLSTEVEGNTFYLGTYGTNTSISASNVSYIEDTSKIGVSQFVAWLATAMESDAPVEDDTTGDDTTGGEEEKPVYEDVVTMVDTPVAGTAYKLLIDQKTNGDLLYFNGKTESESVTYRLATTTDAAKAVDVYLEEVEGGYLLYFMDGETKTYIKVYERTAGDPGYGKGSLEYVTEAPAEYYTYDATAKTLIYTKDENNAYYMGTYSTYTTVSVSNTYYITGDNAAKVDVEQFPARFATVELAEREEVTLASIAVSGNAEYTVGDALALTVTATYSDGSTDEVEAELAGYDMSVAGTYIVTATYEGLTATIEITVKEAESGEEGGDEPTEPTEPKAYKLQMNQVTNGQTLYFNGSTESSSVTYRLAATEAVAEAVDVYLEEVEGGYLLYFMDGETKTYIRIYERTDGDAGKGKGSLELTTTAPAEVLVMDETYNTLVYVADADNSYYLGTYGTYVTFSVSNYSYLSAANVDDSQFPARLVEVESGEEGGDEPTEPTEPKAYKLQMNQVTNGQTLYFNGSTESSSVTYRLAATEAVAEAVDVYLEEVEGGYLLYFMDGETKTYIRIYERTDGDAGKGKGSLELTTTAPAEVLVMDETYNTLVYVADADNSYYLGTYGTYVTFSVSNYSYLSAANVDDSQFPARLVEDAGSEETPAVTLTGIEVTAPTKVEYTVGEEFDATGLVVTATYSDGSTKDVTTEATLTGYDMSVAGTYTVTATYEDKTASFEITVKAAESGEEGGETEVTAVTITFDDAAKRTTSTTTEQVWEENGITFTYKKGSYTNNLAEYANPIRCYKGTSIELAYESMVKIEFTCGSASYATVLKNSIGDAATVDGKVVTVEFAEAVDSYEIAELTAQVRINSITVYSTAVTEGEGGETTEVTLTGIEVTAPTKVEYTVGEEFEATGLVVTAIYSDGSTKDVTAEATLTGYDMSVAGTYTVTATYEGLTATFTITVKEAEGGETETVPTYKKVTSEDDFTTGTYVVVVSGKMVTTLSGSWVLVDDFTATGDTITGEFSTWTITVDGTSAVLTDSNGATIKPKGGNNNGIASGAYSWAWSYSDDAFTFAGTGSDTVILAANAGSSYKLRGYKTTTVSGNPTGYPSNFTLYKLVTE